MKPIKQITNCEFCDAPIDIGLTQQSYEDGQIHILDALILLPKRVVKQNHKDGVTDIHATNLNGYYCNCECLMNRINNILK
jgi:hypothetical protein